MHIKDIDLNLLRLFDAVYRTRNVSRAAELLDLTQPAASQGLSRLRTLVQDPASNRFFAGVWASVGYGSSSWWWVEEDGLHGQVFPVHGLPRKRLVAAGATWTPDLAEQPAHGPNGWWIRSIQRLMAVAVS